MKQYIIDAEFMKAQRELIEAGKELYTRGWVPATSGNFSARLSDGTIAITVSGRHKGKLQVGDFLLLSPDGTPVRGSDTSLKPSAETLLHLQIYRKIPQAGAVLHPHSPNATLLSRLSQKEIILQDYELLKAFEGIKTHDCRIHVPIFPNDQNIERLSSKIEEYFEKQLPRYEPFAGYLIGGHGFYTWGNKVEDAMRHVEAFEFLFDCEIRLHGGKIK